MGLLELGFKLLQQILLLDNLVRVVPLARGESARDSGTIGGNLLKLEGSTGSVESRLERIRLAVGVPPVERGG